MPSYDATHIVASRASILDVTRVTNQFYAYRSQDRGCHAQTTPIGIIHYNWPRVKNHQKPFQIWLKKGIYCELLYFWFPVETFDYRRHAF